jgi:serine protease Do
MNRNLLRGVERMGRKFQRLLLATLIAAAFGNAAVMAAPPRAANEPTPALRPIKEEKRSNRPRGGRESGNWLERYSRFRALDKHERDHESVRVAFRDVVNEPHKATVRILSDDKSAALGSIVDPDGYILTKASELTGKLSVKLHDKRIFDAEIIGIDRKTDLAMIKINAKDLPVIAWRDAQDIPSVGSFLASASLETLPVAIGIVSVQPRLIAAPSGILGVVLEDGDGKGARVHQLMDNSPAVKAGIQKGDLITTLNGQSIKGREQLVDSVRTFQPGDRISLSIQRGEEKLDIEATLAERPKSPDSERGDFQNTLGGPLSVRRAGFPLALQHDTVLTPEDCGGPLVDLDGLCVGINIARAGRVNSYALPTSVILPLVAELKAGKFSPSPSAETLKVELAKRWEELKQSESSLASKLTQVGDTIRVLQAASDQDREERLKKAEAERMAAETELGKVKAELAKLENQKTSLQK